MARTIQLKGDKSLSHRYLIFQALTQAKCQLENLSDCADVRATQLALKQLHAPPFSGSHKIHCGNSGTTLRLLTGLLHGFSGNYEFTGDQSLLKRPMERIHVPLQKIAAGSKNYRLPIASAQVKSALLLYALTQNIPLSLTGEIHSRDHTEIFLEQQNLNFTRNKEQIFIHDTYNNLRSFKSTVPGDISSAAFLILNRLLHPGDELVLSNVLLNPTRAAYLDVLKEMQAAIETTKHRIENGELLGDIIVNHRPLSALNKIKRITKDQIPFLIDELPMLVTLLSHLEGETVIESVQELKVKESNRITELQRMLAADALQVAGPDLIIRQAKDMAKEFQSQDHRLEMSFLAGVKREQRQAVLANYRQHEVLAVSYPGFLSDLSLL